MVLFTTAAGTIIQMARGLASFLTKSASETAPTALPLAKSFTAFGNWSKTTHRWPFLISRRTMLEPIRPSPIMPNFNVCSFNFLFRFIADDILGRRLGRCYGVLTPLFASAKGAKVLMANNVFIQSFSRACLGAIETTSRRGKTSVAVQELATAVIGREEICLTA